MKFILFLLLVMSCQLALGQYAIDSISLEKDLSKWYDQQLGLQNTILQHGELAVQSRKSPNSHPYYGQSNW